MVERLLVLTCLFFLAQPSRARHASDGQIAGAEDDSDCGSFQFACGHTASKEQPLRVHRLEALRTLFFHQSSLGRLRPRKPVVACKNCVELSPGDEEARYSQPTMSAPAMAGAQRLNSARKLKKILKNVFIRLLGRFRKKKPATAVGIDGGDKWGFAKVSKDELYTLLKEATIVSTDVPAIAQYFPARRWLYGSAAKNPIPPELIFNIAMAVFISWLSHTSGFLAGPLAGVAGGYFAGVAKAWTLSATMISFTLSFFLNKSYEHWRSIYLTCRRIQGRISDIALLSATYAARDPTTGSFTAEAEELLRTIARYCRLFQILLYASVTSRYAPLKSPQAIDMLVSEDLLTSAEKDTLLKSSIDHNTVIGWLALLIDTAASDGRLCSSYERSQGTRSSAVPMVLQDRIVVLRTTYASLKDQLVGRMPLAYVHLIQIITDALIFFTPVALTYSVGTFGVVMSTAVVTFFYSIIVFLAKLFLDPLNNELEKKGSESGPGGIRVATLLQETNFGTDRWRLSTSWVPDEVWFSPRAKEASGR